MKKEDILKKYFNYDDFRYPQNLLIDKILERKDVLAILPTGFGKSLIYQIPGLIFTNLCLVISPLIALMKDQVYNLNKLGIKAAYLASDMPFYERKKILDNIKHYKFLYVCAERLPKLPKLKIDLVVIDEAHTLLWGLEFRRAMLEIKDYILNLEKRPVVTAFSATANKSLISFIEKTAGLINPYLYVSEPLRNNIKIKVLKYNCLIRIINKFIKEKIIIYTLTCRKVDHLYNKLKENYQISKYHGSLTKEEKDYFQKEFKENKTNIMIATQAYGMGIDIPNIRAVILIDLPLNMRDLLQQIGRVGRDGKMSYAYIIYSPSSFKVALSMIKDLNNKDALKEYDEVVAFCDIKDKIAYIKKIFK